MARFKDGLGGAVRIGKRQVYRSLGRYRYYQDGATPKWVQLDAAEDVPAGIADIDIPKAIKEIRAIPWKSITRMRGVGTYWHVDGFGELVGSSYVFDTGDLT